VVERGQRSEPAWLRAHPGRRHFELEKMRGTQILANVWDMDAARSGDCVNKIEARKLPFGIVAPHRGHVSNSNGLPDSGDTILVPVYSTTCDHLRIQEDRSHHPRKERSPVVWRQLLFSVSYITP